MQRGDNRVRIRRASFAAPQEIVVRRPGTPAAPARVPTAPAAAAALAGSAHPRSRQEPAAIPNLLLVKIAHRRHLLRSRLAGRAAVRARRRTRAARQGALHHRTMKLMNEIEAEVGGIDRKQAGDERAAGGVRGGLFAIRPV